MADAAREIGVGRRFRSFWQMMDLYDFVGGYGHLVMIGRSGFMTHAGTEKSIDLFAREVLPRLKEIAPVQAGFNQQVSHDT